MKVQLFIALALSLAVVGHCADVASTSSESESENHVMDGYRMQQPITHQLLQQQHPIALPSIGLQRIQQQPIVGGASWQSWQQVQPQQRVQPIFQQPIQEQHSSGQLHSLPVAHGQEQQSALKQSKIEGDVVPSSLRFNLAPVLRFTSSPSITTSIHSANQFVTPSITATRHITPLNQNQDQQPIQSGFVRAAAALPQQLAGQKLQSFGQEQAAAMKAALPIEAQQPVKVAVLSFRPLFSFPVLRKSLKGSMFFDREPVLSESAAVASLDVSSVSSAAKLKLEKFRLKLKMHKLKNMLIVARLNNIKMKQDALRNQQDVQKLGWTQQYALVRDAQNKWASQEKFLKMRLGLNALRGRLLQMRVRRFLTKQMMLKDASNASSFGLGGGRLLRSRFLVHPSPVIRPWMVRHAIKQQRIMSRMKNRINDLQAQLLSLRSKQSKFASVEVGKKMAVKSFGLSELPALRLKQQQTADDSTDTATDSTDSDVVNKKMKFSFEGIKTGADESDEDAQKRKMNVQFDFSYPKRDEATALAADKHLLNAGGFGSIRLVGGGFKSRAVGSKKVTQAGKLNVLINVAKTVTDLEKDLVKGDDDSDSAATIDEQAIMKQEKVEKSEKSDKQLEAEAEQEAAQEQEQAAAVGQEQEQKEMETASSEQADEDSDAEVEQDADDEQEQGQE